MIVKKKINNNFAICLDSKGQEIIAYGKGIGFGKTPYRLDDLSKVERTFYDINNHMYELASQIPDNIFAVSTKIVDMANIYLNNDFSSNLIFSLADHISFAIERQKKGMFIANPLGKDIMFLYEKELEMGKIAVNIIESELGTPLPKKEAHNIAIHFIEAEFYSNTSGKVDQKDLVIAEIIDLVEKKSKLSVDKDSIGYARFVTHLEYLLKRVSSQVSEPSVNLQLFEKTKNEFPETYELAVLIGNYISTKLKYSLNEEELLYLIIHMNRLFDKSE